MPDMKPIFSSHVDAVGHDPASGELHVRWNDGKTSVYQNVPETVAAQVMNSWSVGQALNEMVKKQFPHRYL